MKVWVSVKEKLPKETGRYWCYVEEQGCLGKSNYQWNYGYNEFDKTFNTDGGKVTHWTELLKAPKG